MSANTTGFLNNSLEFPHWRPLLAVTLSLLWGVLLPITLFFNISLFIALVKTMMKHKPLLVLYGSLLLGLCVDKFMVCVQETVNSPGNFGYCVCTVLALVLLNLPRVFFVIYSAVVVTCQSVLQLLIMKGRHKWQESFKRSIGCLIVSAAVTTFWTACFIISNILSEFPHHCHSFCQTPQSVYVISMEYASLFVVGVYAAFTLAPSFVVTITSSIWAFLTFKKKFMACNEKKDAAFSRRILLLPVLMVFLLFCNNLLSYLITVIITKALDRESLGPHFGNWANILSTLLYVVLDILHALSYPLVLLFLYARLRKTWKSLFLSCCKKCYPFPDNSESSQPHQNQTLLESSSRNTNV